MSEPTRPGWMDHAVSALNAWIGDHLARSGNELHQPLCFYSHNQPLAPSGTPAPHDGRVCVFVHGLGCNESLWNYPAAHPGGGYPQQISARLGYTPLLVRYNSGERISNNGQALAVLLEAYAARHSETLRELVLVGHSMGGLVIRSACHLGSDADWAGKVTDVFYIGSPHLGAPLERFANAASHALDQVPLTASRVIKDVLNTRSEGVKDLRYGNLLESDWADVDPDALLDDRRGPVPWLQNARHHLFVGHALRGVAPFGDAVVPGHSASAGEHDVQPGAPDPEDVVVFAGFDHLSLCRHPEVYRHLEERLGGPRAEPAAPPVAAPAPVDGFDWARLRGFKRLVHDGVELGSRFVEKHHRRASAVPFEIIGYVEPLSEVGKLVRVVHDASLTVTYTSIRVVNAVAEHGDDWVVDRMEEDDSPAS